MNIGTGLAATPVAKAEGELTLASKVRAFIAEAVLQAKGGLTLVECGQLLFALLGIAMAAADEWRNVPGTQRKTWVLDAVGRLYDALLPYMPLPMRLPLVSDVIRQVVMALVSGAVEAILPTVRAAR
jgi:hypothetical protein